MDLFNKSQLKTYDSVKLRLLRCLPLSFLLLFILLYFIFQHVIFRHQTKQFKKYLKEFIVPFTNKYREYKKFNYCDYDIRRNPKLKRLFAMLNYQDELNYKEAISL